MVGMYSYLCALRRWVARITTEMKAKTWVEIEGSKVTVSARVGDDGELMEFTALGGLPTFLVLWETMGRALDRQIKANNDKEHLHNEGCTIVE